MPLRVFPDGQTYDDVFIHVEHTSEAAFHVGERVRVRDSNSDGWMAGTVSQLMPLKVFPDGQTYDEVFIHVEHTGEAAFQVGERVRVRDSNKYGWMAGTVSELIPLKAFPDGQTYDEVFIHVEHTGEAAFQVGERVRVRDSNSDVWMAGTVSKLMPLRVFPDGQTYDEVFIHVKREDGDNTGESFAQPLVRGAYLLIMCANLLVMNV